MGRGNSEHSDAFAKEIGAVRPQLSEEKGRAAWSRFDRIHETEKRLGKYLHKSIIHFMNHS